MFQAMCGLALCGSVVGGAAEGGRSSAVEALCVAVRRCVGSRGSSNAAIT